MNYISIKPLKTNDKELYNNVPSHDGHINLEMENGAIDYNNSLEKLVPKMAKYEK